MTGAPRVPANFRWTPGAAGAPSGETAPGGAPEADARTPTLVTGLADTLSSLSYALDLTEGQPAGHAIRSCLIGMRLAEALGLDDETRWAAYYALILKDAGCSGNASHTATLFGSDDREVKRRLRVANWPRTMDAALHGVRSAAIGRPFLERVRCVAQLARAGRGGTREIFRLRSEQGAAIARRLGLPEATGDAIRALDEHWDGRGQPNGLRGGAIPLGARIAGLAQAVDTFVSYRGVEAAMRMVRARRGTWFDPALVDVLLGWRGDATWWGRIQTPEAAQLVVAAEPAGQAWSVDQAGLNSIAEAFAEIIDARTPFTRGRSSRVATYARAIAEEMALGATAQVRLYQAGLLHDIGQLGVSTRILERPGPLTALEWEAILHHPASTWEILSGVRAFHEFARTAALHHERLDGSGYPWKLDGTQLDLEARVLAVSDAYEAMTSWRPYCAEVPPDTAVFILADEAGERLDADAIAALTRYLERTGVTGHDGEGAFESVHA